MKKTLLSLAFVLFGLSLSAADITIDWTKFVEGAPQTAPSAEKSYTLTDYNVSMSCKQMVQTSQTVGGSTTYWLNTARTGGYAIFTLPINCSEIKLTTSEKNTATSGLTVTPSVDGTNFADAVSVVGVGTEFSIEIPENLQAAGTAYKLTMKGTPKFAEITFVEAVTSEATIKVTESTLAFAAPLKATQTLTLKGEAKNIDSDIAVSVDNEAFTVPATITADQLAAGFDVTFTAAAAGESSATLTLAAGELKETVALTAVAVAHEGTETDPLTVADVIALNSLNEGPWYVTGTIGDKSLNGTELDEPNKYNIILTGENDSYIVVNFGANDNEAMEKLNVVDNAENAGKTVVIKGELKALSSGAPAVWSPQYISGLPDTETGIAGIEADSNAPVEYFNLQGIRVANPENGLYIRRQGNKVTKVYVK